jgi:DNA-directed RNA polymerase III subunit RPC4
VPEDVDKAKPPAHVDGVIGKLEIYQSGAVKMRLANGIVLDVRVLSCTTSEPFS